jgi:hypothetical protein
MRRPPLSDLSWVERIETVDALVEAVAGSHHFDDALVEAGNAAIESLRLFS